MINQIPKAKFIALMKKGYEQLGYARYVMWTDGRGDFLTPRAKTCNACALGAAAYAARAKDPEKWAKRKFSNKLWGAITMASDTATGKEAVIKAVSKIRWSQ